MSCEYTGTEIYSSVQRKHVNVLYSILRNSSLMHMCTCVSRDLIMGWYGENSVIENVSYIKSIGAVIREEDIY